MFSLWVWLLVPRSFLFSSVYVFNRVFWGGCYRMFTAWVHIGLRLCTTYIKWETWWAWALKTFFVCVLYIWSFRLYFLLGYDVFQHCRKRTKSTLKNNFFIEEYIFPRKVIIKETVMVGHHSCVALCCPFASWDINSKS